MLSRPYGHDTEGLGEKMNRTVGLILFTLCGILLFDCTNTRGVELPTPTKDQNSLPNGKEKSYSGHMFLYGESHGNKKILEKEFDLWNDYYKKGMRHLFVELPYYTGEFLNIWMKASDDSILDAVYKDWEGTASHNQYSLNFYMKIKKQCRETVFHGTDVGHQYDSTGDRYLKYLEEKNLKGTKAYVLAKENIAQGIKYYNERKSIYREKYRENMMVENFEREANQLNGQAIMGIYGSAHTGLNSKDSTGSIPCMATQLKAVYGSAIGSIDLSSIAKDIDPIRTEKVIIAGKEYIAYYYGRQNLNGIKNYLYRDFWKIENGYADFKNNAKTGDVLPYSNYPMTVNIGDMLLIDYLLSDNRTERKYYLSNGQYWNDQLTTEEINIK